MEYSSPSVMVKRLEGEIRQILRKVDYDQLGAKQRKLLVDLQQDLTDARIHVSTYELSETRQEQLDNAKQAKSWLGKAKRCMLSASEFDIFGAIDVAHLSAQIDQLTDKLE